MILERLGKKYWCPDTATTLDETTGRYSGISASELVPYSLYLLQQELAAKQEELTSLQAETTDAALLAWAKAESPVVHRLATVDAEVAELELQIANHTPPA